MTGDNMENPDKQENNRNPDGTFKEGISGNPKGRPPGPSLTEAIKKRLKELSPDNKRTVLEWMADNILQDALDHDNTMRKLLWNYVDGMPHQSVDLKHDISDNLFDLINNAIREEEGDTIPGEDTERT